MLWCVVSWFKGVENNKKEVAVAGPMTSEVSAAEFAEFHRKTQPVREWLIVQLDPNK